MAKANKTSIPAAPVGVLALLAAVVSLVSHYTIGQWPARLGGWEIPLFLLFGVILLLYSRWRSD